MKKIYLGLFCLALSFAALAQCTPDASVTKLGISPSDLPVGYVVNPYSTAITAVQLKDTFIIYNSLRFNLVVDSAKILAISGLPDGIVYETGNYVSISNGRVRCCARIFGNPNAVSAGVYVIKFTIRSFYRIVGTLTTVDNIDSITASLIIVDKPTVKSFVPNIAAKGEEITIFGKNFFGTTKINFGSDTAFSFIVINDSIINAIVGNGSSGSVIVTNPGGNEAKPGFTFIPAPKIISVSPMKAPSGATITIVGNNFNNSNFVKFGGTASVFTVVSNTIITAKIETGSSGFISIQTPGGLDSIDGFNFIPAPKITLFTPTSAKAGETVIIIGANFNEANKVSFGGMSAKSFSVLTSNTITAIIDTGNGGSVKVTTPGGSDSITGFIYIPVTTGLLELYNNQIKIFPNPAQETITIKSDLNLNGKVYCIYNLMGNSILTGKLIGELNTIPITELKNGVYLVSIFDSNNDLTITKKISVIK